MHATITASDQVCTMASYAGQLKLNYVELIMIHHILAGLEMLNTTFESFANYCIKGIVAGEDRCKTWFRTVPAL